MLQSIKHSLSWAGYKFASTVLDDIWPQALFFTGVATMVACVSKFTNVDLGMNSTMLSVLGTVVSLVVSFKTNNSYLRWWEGRNVWTNITSNSRQLAMLIWLQVPNRPKPKDDDKEKDKPKANDKKPDSKSDHDMKRFSSSSAGTQDHPVRNWHKKGSHDPHDPATEPLLTLAEGDEEVKKQSRESLSLSDKGSVLEREDNGERARAQERAEKEREKIAAEREELEGIIEKKTYIGLIQAFSVAMKHSLRGEKGPFYSDLYSLIAFLPKYNPCAFPPIHRDHLLVLWQHGIPRQKWHSADDVLAVPLTQPAAFDGRSFAFLDSSEKQTGPSAGHLDKESNPTGLTTSSTEFKEQAVKAAAKFVNSDDPDVVGFAALDSHNHRLCRDNSPPREGEKVTIASIELMPPRHPPAARFWDFFPPLRIIKIIIDYFKTQKRIEEQERARGGKRRRGANTVKSEIPQEILMYISAYVTEVADRGDLNSSFLGPLLTAIMELQKAISDLDKIATTPIPSAYSFHLRLTVWAYLFFLPFQLYQYIGWLAIPATAVASIVYLGFLEIGAQIEMPFGYDQSDLDLDKFVLKISQQLTEVTAFPTRVPVKSVVLSHLNQPFLPSLSLSATQLLGEPEPTAVPTTAGFAAAYPSEDKDKDKDKDKDGKDSGEGKAVTAPPKPPLPKTVRDIELALNANWREVGDETKKVLGRQRDQLENKTGLEVAVLAL